MYQFDYLHEYEYAFSLETVMFDTNYENFQNVITHDYSYDLNFYRLISDYSLKNIDVHMIDVKFISIRRLYIFFLKNNVNILKFFSENLNIAFNKRIKRLLSKIFNRFN